MTLYTLDIETNQKKAIKTAFIYLLISLFCTLFGAVYELFSYEVYSYHMIYAFAFPLVGGVLPFLVIGLSRSTQYPGMIAQNLYHSGIATLTVGSIVLGVLDIYGTTNSLIKLYWIVGIFLVVMGAVVYLLRYHLLRVR